MASPKPRYKDAAIFITAHLGKGVFAPFTGTDYPAWRAFVYLCELYGVTGPNDHVLAAMRQTLLAAQDKEAIRAVFRQTIPAILDWGHVDQIWPVIADGHEDRYDDAIQSC